MGDRTFSAEDGRRNGYAEFGDPNGKPVFFFHGMPGSRLFRPPDAITTKCGVRLITVDRPGYGQSDFQPHRRILDWPRDISQLADSLGIGRFYAAGHSGGGPYVLACAYELPERVIAAAVISGAGPANGAGATNGMSPLNKFGITYGRFIPWLLWRGIIWLAYHQRISYPAAAMDRGNGNRPPADDALLRQPEVRQACLESENEAFRSGSLGMAWDAHLLTKPWGFSLSDIQVPVHVWQGSNDDLATPEMGRSIANQIPGSTITICNGEAHLFIFPFWEAILSQLITE